MDEAKERRRVYGCTGCSEYCPTGTDRFVTKIGEEDRDAWKNTCEVSMPYANENAHGAWKMLRYPSGHFETAESRAAVLEFLRGLKRRYGEPVMHEKLIEELTVRVETACRSANNAFGYGIWTHHIKPMLGIADGIAVRLNADREIVTIAVLLHDLAAIKDIGKREDHHLHGANEAEELLNRYGYPPEKTELVKRCIFNHRSSVNNAKTSPEESCVADADAVAHMTEIASLFYAAYAEMGMEIDEGRAWVKGKIERDWRKLSEASKELNEKKYRSILGALE